MTEMTSPSGRVLDIPAKGVQSMRALGWVVTGQPEEVIAAVPATVEAAPIVENVEANEPADETVVTDEATDDEAVEAVVEVAEEVAPADESVVEPAPKTKPRARAKRSTTTKSS